MKQRNTLLCLAGTVLAMGIGCSKAPEPQAQTYVEPTQTSPVPAAQPADPVPPAALVEAPPPPRPSAFRPVKKSERTPVQAPQSVSQPPAQVAGSPAPPPPAPQANRAADQPPVRTPPPPPEPMRVKLASGTVISARLGDTLSSEKNAVGDQFSATLSEPLVVNGFVIAERGSRVEGKVVDLDRAGKVKGTATLQLALTRLHTADGQSVPIQTDAFLKKGPDSTKSDVGKVAIATGIGAAIGAIAGKGKGAGIGAGAGAAAGTGAVLATRGKPAEVPSETLLRFTLSEPVTITERIR